MPTVTTDLGERVKAHVLHELRGSGPMTYAQILAACSDQVVGFRANAHYDIVSWALTALIRQGSACVYDTGHAFDSVCRDDSGELTKLAELAERLHELELRITHLEQRNN